MVIRKLVPCLVGLTVLTVQPLPGIAQSQPGQPSGQAKPSKLQPAIAPVSQLEFPGVDGQLWDSSGQRGDRKALLVAIDRSLRYLQTRQAIEAYRKYIVPGVTHNRVWRSLQRFRQLLLVARSPVALQSAVEREFVFYQSAGQDGQGTVAFTGYFEPIHAASRVPSRDFPYPIYRLPASFGGWKTPHPTRLQLEGEDGLRFAQGPLRGSELAWLSDRLEAYLIQVQGSARLQLTDGSTMSIGYAGHTNYPYTSIGKELVKAGKIRQEDLTLPALMQYFAKNPADLSVYLPRNQRFVFFAETGGGAATGSLGVPVTPERSIATDKSVFPPGALALIQTQIPYTNPTGQLESRLVTRYVLDQDTGGAIRGAGRVDIFMGTGKQAGDRAGLINSPGRLYYLLLK
ncbi:MAG: MltA domain-containing protein [Kovacikia sp.]